MTTPHVNLIPRLYSKAVLVRWNAPLNCLVGALMDAQREIAEHDGVEATVDYCVVSKNDDRYCMLQITYKSPETAMDRAQEAAKVRREKEMRRAQYIALRAEFDH